MKYVKVDSSQIAEVGYGEGFYGSETLALRFPPTKKQKAAGEPGSEYHYQNVTPEMHQEFMAAESIDSYFERNIKPFPEKYPFTKVEADPQHPAAKASESASGKSGNDTTRTKASQQPSPDTDGDAATDQPSPAPTMEEIADGPQAFVYKEAPASTSVFQHPRETHNQAYNREAVEALMGCALTRHEAMSVLTAIVEGRIPHVTITY